MQYICNTLVVVLYCLFELLFDILGTGGILHCTVLCQVGQLFLSLLATILYQEHS